MSLYGTIYLRWYKLLLYNWFYHGSSYAIQLLKSLAELFVSRRTFHLASNGEAFP